MNESSFRHSSVKARAVPPREAISEADILAAELEAQQRNIRNAKLSIIGLAVLLSAPLFVIVAMALS